MPKTAIELPYEKIGEVVSKLSGIFESWGKVRYVLSLL